jgi:hypothetical protein
MLPAPPTEDQSQGCAILTIRAAGTLLACGGICAWFYIVFFVNGGHLDVASISAVAAIVTVLLLVGGVSSKS